MPASTFASIVCQSPLVPKSKITSFDSVSPIWALGLGWITTTLWPGGMLTNLSLIVLHTFTCQPLRGGGLFASGLFFRFYIALFLQPFSEALIPTIHWQAAFVHAESV